MPERVVSLANSVSAIASDKVAGIQKINARTRLLALNALIEATRAGTAGAGFGVVAQEVKSISREIDTLTAELTKQLEPRLAELDALGQKLVAAVRGNRLADLALNLIEIIDRNLYERSCDVRWWAADAAIVAACGEESAALNYASQRLGIILDNYTVYCDLVICDVNGKVLTHGRRDKYPALSQAHLGDQSWFRDALKSKDGTQFAVADVFASPELRGQTVAAYAAAIRENGDVNGRPIGVLGVFFDWGTQAQTVVEGVRISAEEKSFTRALIVDAQHKVIASSDRIGLLKETFHLTSHGQKMGHYQTDQGSVVGFAVTPGYETYRGLGWYGVLVQHRGRG